MLDDELADLLALSVDRFARFCSRFAGLELEPFQREIVRDALALPRDARAARRAATARPRSPPRSPSTTC